MKEERDRYLATLTLGVDRTADARGMDRDATPRGRPERPPPGPGGGPPPGFREPARMTMKDRLAALVPGLRRGP